ncbi:hypothetical protein BC941DRAFT_501071 [Chlamydoabsidia padenii]|nr:hypothetical protein BC941DRAFT_501071 [Chlamydoabsidia padenii]
MEQTTINNTTNIHPLLFSTTTALHPLSSSPNTFFHQQTSMTIPSLTDDVTTIFVVGFPDDMTEREFQNMFMFCPGFEAASLKWHCKDQEDDNSVGSNGGKKQMIGFARFRTRLEAMEAADILGGKKVDQDKGTVLKAEMAKKNLHVKRGSVAPVGTLVPSSLLQHQQSIGSPTSSNTPPCTTPALMISGESSSLSSTSGTINTDSIGESESTTNEGALDLFDGTMSLLSKKLGRYPTNSESYDAFSPLPSDLLSPATDYKTDPFLNDPFVSNNNTATTPVFPDSLFGNVRSNSFDGRRRPSDISFISPRPFGSLSSGGGSNNNNNNNNMAFNQTTSNNLMMGPSPLSKVNNFYNHPYQMSPFNTTNTSTKVTNDENSYDYLSKSTPVSNDRLFGTSPILDDLMSSRMNSLSMQANNLTDVRSSSTNQQQYHRSSINPADQNPPCNTLYVGNLPSNTNEDELNELFSQCKGYKRMCFRNKPQGPMCFVEFDDVVLATNALNELQGHGLTNSVKGGIRLSFSKNPLFIKNPFFTSSNDLGA